MSTQGSVHEGPQHGKQSTLPRPPSPTVIDHNCDSHAAPCVRVLASLTRYSTLGTHFVVCTFPPDLTGVVDKATSTAISPARISSGLKDSYPDFVGHISKRDPKWWKKYGTDTSTALVLVDDQAVQDKIKEYLFPHLIEGTGLLIQSVAEWWDQMVIHCDSNQDGRLELKDMEKCRFDLIDRPKTFGVLVERLNTFLSNQENVEHLWRYILEQQHAVESGKGYRKHDHHDHLEL